MNAARIAARTLAQQWRLAQNVKHHYLLQQSSAINCAIKQVRPICLTSTCRQETQGNADEVINVTFQEFVHHLKNSSSTVIDVRNPEELVETGMIPGSINIPLPILEKTLDLPADQFQYLYGVPKPRPDDEIIFSCKRGNWSRKATLLALGKGFLRARQYPRGWIGFVEEQNKSNH